MSYDFDPLMRIRRLEDGREMADFSFVDRVRVRLIGHQARFRLGDRRLEGDVDVVDDQINSGSGRSLTAFGPKLPAPMVPIKNHANAERQGLPGHIPHQIRTSGNPGDVFGIVVPTRPVQLQHPLVSSEA